ncbi:hypothetical protein FOA52_008761 [Chlamydomonas sp. UWO 241]|nr:hypothetical protein FOA52_008761 [Chlamydomonas sp. UWO 241]
MGVAPMHTRACPASRPAAGRQRLAVRAGLGAEVQAYAAAATVAHPGLLYGTGVNSAVFALGYGVLRKGLTVAGVAHAWVLGTSVYAAFGWGGHLLMCLYFALGTAVTKLKLKQKQAEGIAEARSGQRGPASVWGSGLAAVMCAWGALLTGSYGVLSGSYDLWQIGFVASVCSKLSDTVSSEVGKWAAVCNKLSDTMSSEVGKAYGKTTFLITTFERVPRGTEGAVSAEGTMAGIAAAALFSGVALGVGQVDPLAAAIVAAAAVAANTFESYLGAVVQGKVAWLTNDGVNMIQICVAAALAMAARAALG